MSYFLIFYGIVVLVIASRIGEWNNNEFWYIFITWSEFSKGCCTSAWYGYISILYEMSDIFLRNPRDCLTILYICKSRLHISIQFSESHNPLIGCIILELIDYGIKYTLSSLTPTYYKNMRLIRLPYNSILMSCYFGRVIWKYRIQYLSHYFTFFCIKIFFCIFESKEYFFCESSERPIGSPRNSIRFMDIKRNSKWPSSNPYSNRARSSFWKDCNVFILLMIFFWEYLLL